MDRGFDLVEANVRTTAGEADLLVQGSRRWVVEVKACMGDGRPLDRVDEDKERRLWAIAAELGSSGVLLVEVRLTPAGALVGISPG